MTVPSEPSDHVVSGGGGVPRDHVLDRAGQDVSVMRQSRREGGSVVEHELRHASGAPLLLVEGVQLVPEPHHPFLLRVSTDLRSAVPYLVPFHAFSCVSGTHLPREVEVFRLDHVLHRGGATLEMAMAEGASAPTRIEKERKKREERGFSRGEKREGPPRDRVDGRRKRGAWNREEGEGRGGGVEEPIPSPCTRGVRDGVRNREAGNRLETNGWNGTITLFMASLHLDKVKWKLLQRCMRKAQP